ncbi:hypothetical protein [Candidatus Chloroploca asiatica]|uniref:hypothetical protein n=1 Tax=Candidatus Chloroploca asiatica TaxID=1506545 RepID=UPI001143B351|nr:hypothetical protein [Candidatus Chloroploca asiatica]
MPDSDSAKRKRSSTNSGSAASAEVARLENFKQRLENIEETLIQRRGDLERDVSLSIGQEISNMNVEIVRITRRDDHPIIGSTEDLVDLLEAASNALVEASRSQREGAFLNKLSEARKAIRSALKEYRLQS